MISKEITIEGQTFKVASIRVGQMRELTEATLKRTPGNGNGSFVNDNIQTVSYCLQNGGNEEYSIEFLEKMPWPIYRHLLELCSELSGFNLKDQPSGEAMPQPIGVGSTDGLPRP